SNGRTTVQGIDKIAIVRDALSSVIGALTDATGGINVGLVTFNGSLADASVSTPGEHDGAHVRYAARSMSVAANRAALVAALRGIEAVPGAAPGAQYTLALEEVRRYLGGLPVLHGA